MLATLPESASRIRRDPAGIAWSVAVHLGAIAMATLASASVVDSTPRPTADTTLIYLPTPEPTRCARCGRGGGETGNTAPVARSPVPLPAAPPTVPIDIPPVDPFAPVIDGTDLDVGTSARRALERGSGGGGDEDYSSHRLAYVRADRGAAALPANPRPRYPDVLRNAGVEGSVLAEFVVDTSGAIVLSSVRILESDHPLFEVSVRELLPRLRFTPAEANGHRVRQWVRQPFQFRLTRR